jgi:hypothetical protein
MVKQFSKEIDIVSFWPQEDIDLFVDKSIIKATTKERDHFADEWKRFCNFKD